MIRYSLEGYPLVVEESHELFDEEIVDGQSDRIDFFQNRNTFMRGPGREKVLGLHTNMLENGSVPKYCSKEIVSAVVTVSEGKIPEGCAPSLVLYLAQSEVYRTPFEFGEPVSLRASELILVPPGLSSDDQAALIESMTGAVNLVAWENFRLSVVGAPANTRLRVTLRGRYVRPDFFSKEFAATRSMQAVYSSRRAGRGQAVGSPTLFDEEYFRPEEERSLFRSAVTFGRDESVKQHNVNTNLVGNGGRLPMGHTKVVKSIRLQAWDVEGQERKSVEDLHEVQFRFFGHKLQRWGSVKHGDKLVLEKPFLLCEGDSFDVFVKRQNGAGLTLVRIGLDGPYFTPSG